MLLNGLLLVQTGQAPVVSLVELPRVHNRDVHLTAPKEHQAAPSKRKEQNNTEGNGPWCCSGTANTYINEVVGPDGESMTPPKTSKILTRTGAKIKTRLQKRRPVGTLYDRGAELCPRSTAIFSRCLHRSLAIRQQQHSTRRKDTTHHHDHVTAATTTTTTTTDSTLPVQLLWLFKQRAREEAVSLPTCLNHYSSTALHERKCEGKVATLLPPAF